MRARLTINLAVTAMLAASIGACDVGRIPTGPAAVIARVTKSSYGIEQIRHAYGFDRVSETGAHQIVAVVEAYENLATAADLRTFSNAFHLTSLAGLDAGHPCTVMKGPHPCFQALVLGRPVEAGRAWADESATSVEWLHGIAGAADLLLVEAASDSLSDLMTAVTSAVAHRANIVLMTWGMPESEEFLAFDHIFQVPGVTFLAATGDAGHQVNYPAASAQVIAVGGTVLTLDGTGNRIGRESAWKGSGGGISRVEPPPGYQSQWGLKASGRAVPDVAIVAYPDRGFSSYSTGAAGPGWRRAVGTSVSAALWAGLIALIRERRRDQPLDAPSALYTLARGPSGSSFVGVVDGSNGICGDECFNQAGFDDITGLGIPDVPKVLAAAYGGRTTPAITKLEPARAG
jgi:subtilase family serine protease